MRIWLELSQGEAEKVFDLAKSFTLERLQTATMGQATEQVTEVTAAVTEAPILAVTSASPVVEGPAVSIPETYSPLPVVAPIQVQPEAVQQVVPAPVVPTTAQTYTMEQLAVAGTQLVDAGRRQELIGLLGSFGVQALTTLPKESYGAFATQLRAMGAKL